MLKTKRAQLKTMLAHALIFDSPYGMVGTMHCGGSLGGTQCTYHREVTPRTCIPMMCPTCKMSWRFCTAPCDPHNEARHAAEIFNRRLPHLSFFVVNVLGDIEQFTLATVLS